MTAILVVILCLLLIVCYIVYVIGYNNGYKDGKAAGIQEANDTLSGKLDGEIFPSLNFKTFYYE